MLRIYKTNKPVGFPGGQKIGLRSEQAVDRVESLKLLGNNVHVDEEGRKYDLYLVKSDIMMKAGELVALSEYHKSLSSMLDVPGEERGVELAPEVEVELLRADLEEAKLRISELSDGAIIDRQTIDALMEASELKDVEILELKESLENETRAKDKLEGDIEVKDAELSKASSDIKTLRAEIKKLKEKK